MISRFRFSTAPVSHLRVPGHKMDFPFQPTQAQAAPGHKMDFPLTTQVRAPGHRMDYAPSRVVTTQAHTLGQQGPPGGWGAMAALALMMGGVFYLLGERHDREWESERGIDPRYQQRLPT